MRENYTSELIRAHQGGKLSRRQAKLLEKKAAADPNDVKTRVSLLGYYHRSSVLSWSGFIRYVLFGDSMHQCRYIDLVKWLVEHRSQFREAGLPEMYPPLGFDKSISKSLKELWEKQLDKFPDNVAVLCNAAAFFSYIDKSVSEELLRSAQKLEPDNAYLAGRLSLLYELGPLRSSVTWSEALSQKETQIAKSLSVNPYDLGDLARLAFANRDYEKAELAAARQISYASERNELRSDHGNAIHDGNNMLGRIAVLRGDISAAKDFLGKASGSVGSPSLCTFGPDMTLAQDLLKIGERKTVIDYLWACHRFWNGFHGTVPTLLWIFLISVGFKPRLNRIRPSSEENNKVD